MRRVSRNLNFVIVLHQDDLFGHLDSLGRDHELGRKVLLRQALGLDETHASKSASNHRSRKQEMEPFKECNTKQAVVCQRLTF